MELKRKTLDESAKAEAEGKDVRRPGVQKASEPKAIEKPKVFTSDQPMSAAEIGLAREASLDASTDSAQSDAVISGRRVTRFRKIILLSIASCLILGGAGFLYIKSKNQSGIPSNKSQSENRSDQSKPETLPEQSQSGTPADDSQSPEPLTAVMRPIPQPDYREMLDFLLAYESAGQKMITAIRLEIGYQSPTRYQNFKEQNVTFRDTVYSFLLRQDLSGNSVKSWHSVLEKDLLNFLMVKLPQSYPDKILLTQVENL